MFEVLMMTLYRLVKRDSMSYRIRRYRKQGMAIGENVRLFTRIESSEPYLLEFGDGVTVSGDVTFITHDNAITKMSDTRNNLFGRIKIGDNCFVGYGAIVLPGVELGPDVVVGAGSVVTKSFLDRGTIVAGNPARQISTVQSYLDKHSDVAVLTTPAMSWEEIRDHILESPETRLVRR